MIIEGYENINKSTYEELIKQYKSKQDGLIKEFIKSYVLYNKDTTYNEYLQTYNTSKANLDSQNADMFSTINDLQSNINILNTKIQSMDTTITSSLVANTEIATSLTNFNGLNNSSQILIDNSKEMYKDQFINNFSLIIGIIGIIGIIYIIFFKIKKVE